MSLPSWLRKPSPRTVDIGLTVLVALLIVPGTVIDSARHDKALVAAIFTAAAVVPLLWRRRVPFVGGDDRRVWRRRPHRPRLPRRRGTAVHQWRPGRARVAVRRGLWPRPLHRHPPRRHRRPARAGRRRGAAADRAGAARRR